MKTYEMKVIFKSYSDYESGSQDTSFGIWQWLEDHFIDPDNDELIDVKLKVEEK